MQGPGETSALAAAVYVDARVGGDGERWLVGHLADLGVDADVKVVPARRSTVELHWLVLVALPLQAFLAGLGGKLATDAYDGLKRLTRRLVARPDTAGLAPAPLVLQDTASGLRIILEVDLPDEAYEQLFTLDLPRFGVESVRYDRCAHRWGSADDAAAADRD